MKRLAWLSISSETNLFIVLCLASLTFLISLTSPKFLFASTTTRFLYDGDGVRVAKIEEGKTILYVGDMEKNIATGEVARYYSIGGKRVAIKDESGINYIVSEHLGSLRTLTDGEGNVKANIAYYPYGQVRAKTGTAIASRQYTSQINDDTTGLYFYNARYYNPVIAKFTQADTQNAGLNRYAYVKNNPIINIDPSGHSNCPFGTPCYESDGTSRTQYSVSTKVLIMGDSLTEGMLPDYIASGLEGFNPDFIGGTGGVYGGVLRESHRGFKCADILRDLQDGTWNEIGGEKRAVDYSLIPDILVLRLGTNDLSLGTNYFKNTSMPSLTGIITFFQNKNPNIKIVIETVPPLLTTSGQYVDNFNQQLESLVTELQAQNVHINLVEPENFDPARDLYSDGVHPNDQGVAKLADPIIDSLKTMLGIKVPNRNKYIPI